MAGFPAVTQKVSDREKGWVGSLSNSSFHTKPPTTLGTFRLRVTPHRTRVSAQLWASALISAPLSDVSWRILRNILCIPRCQWSPVLRITTQLSQILPGMLWGEMASGRATDLGPLSSSDALSLKLCQDSQWSGGKSNIPKTQRKQRGCGTVRWLSSQRCLPQKPG